VIGLGRRVPVFAYGEIVDMRKSFDTLAAIVREHLDRDVLEGAVYVFVVAIDEERRCCFGTVPDSACWRKRLSKGRFAAPWEKKRGAVLEWTTSELALFLEGSEHVGRVALSPTVWTPDERRVTFT
jgi:transposase